MKNLVIAVILITGIFLLAGCIKPYENDKTDNGWQSIDRGYEIRLITIEGHKYLVTGCKRSVSVIHAASCRCQN